MLKQMNQLKDGKCKVHTKQGEIFDGFYNEKLKVVFFTIPYHYEIVGYEQ